MAKISTYALDNNVSLSDKLIGTDAENNNATKNFSLGQVADLFNDITVLDSFVPYTGALTNVDLGTFNLRASYIEGAEIFSNLLQGNTVDVNDELRIYGGVPISLDGNQGSDGNIMVSQGAADNPAWVSQSGLFLTAPIYQGGNKLTSYAQALSLVNQTQTSVGVAKIVEFETGSFSDTVSIVSNLITFNAIGKYMIEVTARVEHTSGGGDAVLNLWLQNTLGLIANTRQTFTVANTHTQEIRYTFLLNVGNPADAIRVYWSTSNLAARFSAISSVGIFPGAPSTILNVYKIG